MRQQKAPQRRSYSTPHVVKKTRKQIKNPPVAEPQTYSYMLESGVEHSCITTGEATVFLRIEEADPNTLYCHLAEPNEEVSTDTLPGFQHLLTAISQLLSFCLLSF